VKDVKWKLEKLINEQKKLDLLLHHNLSPRRKLLLIGAPGTGKTMTAQAIAGELGIPIFIIRLDGILSKFMGESIVKLRMIFDIMPQQRGVYLFDEFDSIGSHRNHNQDVGEIKRILNSFLINIEKDKSNSIIIAATNLPELLDKALFRRFDDIISYPLPNKTQIVDAIEKYSHSFQFDSKITTKDISNIKKEINFSDVSKASEETKKEMILTGSKKLHKSFFLNSLQSKTH